MHEVAIVKGYAHFIRLLSHRIYAISALYSGFLLYCLMLSQGTSQHSRFLPGTLQHKCNSCNSHTLQEGADTRYILTDP